MNQSELKCVNASNKINLYSLNFLHIWFFHWTGFVLFQDHKPSNPPERERIQNAGGSVMIQRVNGSLAVSRALGDFEYKNVDGKGPTEQLVSEHLYNGPVCFTGEKSYRKPTENI